MGNPGGGELIVTTWLYEAKCDVVEEIRAATRAVRSPMPVRLGLYTRLPVRPNPLGPASCDRA